MIFNRKFKKVDNLTNFNFDRNRQITSKNEDIIIQHSQMVQIYFGIQMFLFYSCHLHSDRLGTPQLRNEFLCRGAAHGLGKRREPRGVPQHQPVAQAGGGTGRVVDRGTDIS